MIVSFIMVFLWCRVRLCWFTDGLNVPGTSKPRRRNRNAESGRELHRDLQSELSRVPSPLLLSAIYLWNAKSSHTCIWVMQEPKPCVASAMEIDMNSPPPVAVVVVQEAPALDEYQV